MTDPRCGTYAGVQQHTRSKTPYCPSCKAARRRYIRAWRERTQATTGRYLTPMEIGHLSGKLGDFW